MDTGSKTTALAARAAAESPASNAEHERLFERVYERIFRYFWRICGDPEAAGDNTQETLLLLESSLREGRYEPGRSFNTWIFLKAHRVYCAWCRSRVRKTTALVEEPLEAPRIEAVERRLDATQALEAVRNELGDEACEAFVLRYEGGLSLDALASVLGCTRKTLGRRLQAAHRVIDRLLEGKR